MLQWNLSESIKIALHLIVLDADDVIEREIQRVPVAFLCLILFCMGLKCLNGFSIFRLNIKIFMY